jgi:DNA polymerase II
MHPADRMHPADKAHAADKALPVNKARSIKYTGWLLDVFAPEGAPQQAKNGSPITSQGDVVLWLLGEDGARRRLCQPFPVTFYVAGPAACLRALWQRLENQPISVSLDWVERRDLFCQEPLTVLAVQVNHPAAQPRLFQQLAQQFPDLDFYDADVHLALRYAATHHIFPLAYCQFTTSADNRVENVTPLDSPWDLDPLPPPLRVMTIDPDVDPDHAPPSYLTIRCERFDYRLPLQPARPLLLGLCAILKRHDPDLLLTSWGDTWLLPHLLKMAHCMQIPLPLNREPGRDVDQRREHTYFSYGQIIHQGRQVHLFGRWHIDRYNAILFHDYGMEGAQELARVTGLPVQTTARVSPGTGISSMQMLTALRQGILIPWRKQQAEHPKSALDLLHADQGGLVYHPIIGLHRDVAEIDFVSMYPGIMARFNISPEMVGTAEAIVRAAQGLDLPGPPAQPGLVPQTLSPLLEKRLALKMRLTSQPAWHPNRKIYKARASAHKWLLVTCFGYLGYKNARFGRIEAHEAVTAYGREALLRAKEAAEDQGFTVLHLYVDGMWVHKPGASTVSDFQPLLDEITDRTGLPVAMEGIYRWVAFLSSRSDRRVPVANRYFGAFQDGTLKYRGIEARRRDTPAFIIRTQVELLKKLAEAHTPQHEAAILPKLVSLLQRRLATLRAGCLPLEELLVTQKLSRVLDNYHTPSPVARAVSQLVAAGKTISPGQHIRFLYTLGEPGVHAWDLPVPPDPASIDTARYAELLLRAASTVLEPFGVNEETLRLWLFSNAGYSAPPGVLPPNEKAANKIRDVHIPLFHHPLTSTALRIKI